MPMKTKFYGQFVKRRYFLEKSYISRYGFNFPTDGVFLKAVGDYLLHYKDILDVNRGIEGYELIGESDNVFIKLKPQDEVIINKDIGFVKINESASYDLDGNIVYKTDHIIELLDLEDEKISVINEANELTEESRLNKEEAEEALREKTVSLVLDNSPTSREIKENISWFRRLFNKKT